ncbi:MAG: DUF309 domain-containing protein [Desulfuromonadales bacterium]|jgi:hypothetical protein|nr:DUF309 domain-containing protein [Desulfuromonadales bacterium]
MGPIYTDRELPRYTHSAFPAYRYLPFQAGMPHPTRDPGGHSYAAEEDDLPPFAAADWRHCQPYLYGVDLFNHGYWWEAHESWERVWLAAGQETPTARFIQGLIQIAAAQLKRFIGQERGARSLTTSGVARLAIDGEVFLGIEVARLVEEVERCLSGNCGDFPRIRLLL